MQQNAMITVPHDGWKKLESRETNPINAIVSPFFSRPPSERRIEQLSLTSLSDFSHFLCMLEDFFILWEKNRGKKRGKMKESEKSLISFLIRGSGHSLILVLGQEAIAFHV